jgi:WD40 repeat protein
VAAGKPVRTLRVERSYHVGAVAFSPDGKTLATGSDGPGSVLRLWDVAAGELIAALDDDDSMVYAVSFSPDGKSLASAGGGAIKLWDVAARKAVATFPQRGGHPVVVFRPDGKALAWGATSWHGGVHCEFRVRDLAAGKETVTLKRPGGLRFLAFHPDGKTVAWGGAVWDEDKKGWAGGLVRLWDAATGKETTLFKGDAGGLMSVAFSKDGRLLAAGGGTPEQGEVRLWRFAAADEKQK